MPTGLELLQIQAERGFDDRGRVLGLHGIRIACTDQDRSVWIGADVPEPLTDALTATFESLPRTGGPSYLIEERVRFESAARIERSDTSSRDALRNANPGNWLPIEWNELLDGRLGPWAMAIEGDRVVSICHTPGPVTARAAECGVWTDPACRGRGLAAAVTSEWAAILRPSGRYLFYSTDAENLSSQRVAQRLGLRPLGWIWTFGRVRAEGDARVHPLSSLR